MTEEITFEFTWCEYLTRCPHFQNVYVGDYECNCCGFNAGISILKDINTYTDNPYKRYCDVGVGVCKCCKK